MGTILIIATMDTKSEEAYYVKKLIEDEGLDTLIMNTGIFLPFNGPVDIDAEQVVKAATTLSISELIKKGKSYCIDILTRGAKKIVSDLYAEKKFDGVIGLGGAQGTDICTAAMKILPFGVPKFMVSTVASGRATFGPFVGTKDIIMMHPVCDIQGLNIVTRSVFENSSAAICGMVRSREKRKAFSSGRKGSIAVSMLGTTTAGALRAKEIIESRGYDFVAFHQNGTGGIAMEEMIKEGFFKGVLDINLHEIGDSYAGGLHASIREGRLESAAKMGLPQVIAPGSVYYTVQGPFAEVSDEMKKRKYIIHNSFLTLVRLTPEELKEVGRIVAEKINRSTGPVQVYIPMQGFAYPDAFGREHWEPEGDAAFIEGMKKHLRKDIPYDELDMHINDKKFIDIAVDKLFEFITKKQ